MNDSLNHPAVVALCSDLIAQKSLSGGEEGAARVMAEYASAIPGARVRTDELGNCLVTLAGGRPGKRVLFDAHLDTVPADPAQWRTDPFTAVVSAAEGRLYGRGSSDMKGSLAAMLVALNEFARRHGADFPGTVVVAGVVYEELFEGIASRAVSAAVKPDIVVIGEATELNLNTGQRGRAEVVLETFGRNAHSSNPGKGHNAVYDMVTAVDRIRRIAPEAHPALGAGILELTDITSSPYPGASVVPDRCRVTFDRRLLPDETAESVLEPLKAILDDLHRADPEFRAAVSFAREELRCYTSASIGGERFFPAWLYASGEPFVQAALAGLRGTGQDPAISAYSFCTNGSHYAGEAGIPTLGYGPSRENLAHVVDEYVELRELDGAVDGYGALMEALTPDR